MSLLRRLTHRHFFLVYVVAGCCLALYSGRFRCDPALESIRWQWKRNLLKNGLQIDGQNKNLVYQIYKMRDASPSRKHHELAARAERATLLADQTNNFIHYLLDPPACPAFSVHLDRAADSLIHFKYALQWLIGQDSAASATLESLLDTRDLMSPFKKLSIADTARLSLLRDGLSWKIWQAQYIALSSLEMQITPPDDTHFDFFTPVLLTSEESCAVAGQPFEAALMLAGYSDGTDLRYTCNDSLLDLKDGIGHWSGRFEAAGVYSLKIEAGVRNPVDCSYKTYVKEYKLSVHQP